MQWEGFLGDTFPMLEYQQEVIELFFMLIADPINH